ncbi:GNAT family N-acetyltransferase [Planctomycetota bacterium]
MNEKTLINLTSQDDCLEWQVSEIQTLGDLVQYREEWETLLANTPRSGFFDTYEWLNTWLEFFWKDRQIAFLLVRHGDTLVALMPLISDESGEIWCRHTLALPINSFATRADLIGDNTTVDIIGAICSYLYETRRTVCLGLKSVETTSSLLPALEQVARCQQLRIQIWPSKECLIVRIHGDWDDYVASRSKNVRRAIKRKRRKLDQAGVVQWRTIASPDNSQAAMEDILRIERRSWKEANKTSFTAVPGLADFFGALSLRCALRGWLRTFILYLDNVPVAHIVGMVYRNEYYAMKMSFDEYYRDLSPGAVLVAYALEQAFAARFRVFDFLGVPMRWKYELANDVRQHVNVCVFTRECYHCRMCLFFENRVKPVIKNFLAFATRPERESPNGLLE